MQLVTLLLCLTVTSTNQHYADKHASDNFRFKNIERRYSLEDAALNFTEIAIKYGNKVEEYDVITEDGYILTIFHVVPQRKLSYTPIVLQHGILDSSDAFILRGKESLVTILSRAGHDIWASNTRGNKYGRRHLRLDPDEDEMFWDFTVNDIGVFDGAAIVDFVLAKSRRDKVTIIGHSLGNSMFFILGSERPEYNDKVNLFIAMAPIAFLHFSKPPLTDLYDSGKLLLKIFKDAGQNKLVVPKRIQQIICTEFKFSYDICAKGLAFALSGADEKRVDRGFFPIVVGHYPQPVALKVLEHLYQIAISKRFRNFDYGYMKNLQIYKTANPRDYNLNGITMPVALFVSQNDKFSTRENVRLLYDKLPNVVSFFMAKPKKWSHLDWIWALDIEKYVYPYLSELLSHYI